MNHRKQINRIILSACSATLLLLASCGEVKVPQQFTDNGKTANIYPQYQEVTIPINIAPLHFEILDGADNYVTRITYPGGEWVGDGFKVCPSIDEWRNMTQAAKGKELNIEVFTENNGQWQRFNAFHINVSADSIDNYLSYRLIAPSYVAYEELTINQRNLTNYDENIIYSNTVCADSVIGQCINCHAYQNYNPNRMQFHARQYSGGTMITYDGKMKKMNLKTDSTLSAGVYPAWHPTLELIAYSTNNTGQSFHTRHPNKIEVQDAASDLILYNLKTDEVQTVSNEPNEFEVFPAWSPDGNYLYYCSAYYVRRDTAKNDLENIKRYKDFKYNVYRKAFNKQTLTFGPREMVFNAAAQGKSATLPRISPDGRFLMVTVGEYGVFHIWHKDADLWMMNLQTDTVPRPLANINSNDVESYHTWSSNGRWVVFSSRRTDGGYTRPFIAHIDANGVASKPFELPQDDPDFHRQFLKSYNIPEFMKGPVTISEHTFADAMKKEATPAKYKVVKQ